MLKKLSLAALIAMGSVSFATATPLTDAIKNVELNGMLRVRFYNEQPDKSNQYNRWRTNAILIFKVPVDENIKFVMRNSVESNVYSDEDSLEKTGTTYQVTDTNGNTHTVNTGNKNSVDTAVANNLLFLQYTNGPVNAIVGKIPVATSVTSNDPAYPGHGAGIVATYKVNDNLTVGAAYVDALKQGGGEADGVPAVLPNDIYAATAIFNLDMVKGNVWYYHITNAVKSLVTASVDFQPIENVDVHADLAVGKDDDKLTTDAETKTYFNIAAQYAQDAFCAKLGYAKTDKDNSHVVLAVDSPVGAVITTANNYNIANKQDVSSVYGKLGYTVDAKTNVYLAAQVQNAGDDAPNKNDDLKEYTIGAKYAYNKKLGFHVYYDIADWDDDATNEDNKEFRFEAKYSF